MFIINSVTKVCRKIVRCKFFCKKFFSKRFFGGDLFFKGIFFG